MKQKLSSLIAYSKQKSNLFLLCFIFLFLVICGACWNEGGSKASILPFAALCVYLYKGLTRK